MLFASSVSFWIMNCCRLNIRFVANKFFCYSFRALVLGGNWWLTCCLKSLIFSGLRCLNLDKERIRFVVAVIGKRLRSGQLEAFLASSLCGHLHERYLRRHQASTTFGNLRRRSRIPFFFTPNEFQRDALFVFRNLGSVHQHNKSFGAYAACISWGTGSMMRWWWYPITSSLLWSDPCQAGCLWCIELLTPIASFNFPRLKLTCIFSWFTPVRCFDLDGAPPLSPLHR